MEELIKKLDSMFIARYGKRFADLNKNVYIAEALETGGFDVPVPSLSGGGGTLVTGEPTVFTLNSPAVATVVNKKMKAKSIVYRIAFSYNELEIGTRNPAYFNYFMDSIIDKALNNYAATIGGPDIVRFGTVYCTYERPGESRSVFRDLEDDKLELRLYGSWASDEEAV